MLFHIVAGSPLELTRRICWFILALAFFSRSSATILKASDFTFGLLCFWREGPSPWSSGGCDCAMAADVQTGSHRFFENVFWAWGDTQAAFQIYSTYIKL